MPGFGALDIAKRAAKQPSLKDAVVSAFNDMSISDPGLSPTGIVVNPANAEVVKSWLKPLAEKGASTADLVLEFMKRNYPRFTRIPKAIIKSDYKTFDFFGNTLGENYPKANYIHIYEKANRTPQQLTETVAHELTHARQALRPSRNPEMPLEQVSSLLWDDLAPDIKDVLIKNGIDKPLLGEIAKEFAQIPIETHKGFKFNYFPPGIPKKATTEIEGLSQPAASVISNNMLKLYANQPIEVFARQGGSTATTALNNFLGLMENTPTKTLNLDSPIDKQFFNDALLPIALQYYKRHSGGASKDTVASVVRHSLNKAANSIKHGEQFFSPEFGRRYGKEYSMGDAVIDMSMNSNPKAVVDKLIELGFGNITGKNPYHMGFVNEHLRDQFLPINRMSEILKK